MTKRRSVLEIRMDILRAIHDGEDKPTRIMYSANLSWFGLKRHLKALINQGLISSRPNTDGEDKRQSEVYEITEKGRKVAGFISEIGRTLGTPIADMDGRIWKGREA